MQVRDELRVLVEAEVARAIENFKKLEDSIDHAAGETDKLGEKLDGIEEKDVEKIFQNLQAATDKAAASMRIFGASSDELRVIQAQLKNAAVDLVAKGIDPQSEDVKKLVDEYKRLEKEADDLDKANGKNISSFGNLQKAIMSLAEVAALAKTLGMIKDMGSFALQTADNFQTMKNQFGTLLGDMEAGAGLFNEIKKFNDVTPFDMSTLTQATNVLISAKVPLQDLQAQLTKFGDLSQGNSQKMTSYVNAFSHAAAKGKADMQVLNTYLNQGVPILDALARNFCVTTEEVVKMSSEGKISFQDFSKALDDLTAAGGQYFGGMELASKSLAAMQEGLKEAVNSLAASFGDLLLPAATNVTGMLTDLTNAINESPIAKGVLAAALTAVTAIMGVMAVKAAALAVKMWLAQAAQMGLNASLAVTNPLLWAGIAAAAAATAGYVYYASSQQKAARATEDNALAAKKLKDAVDEAKNAAYEFFQNMQNIGLKGVLYHIDDLQKKIADLGRNGVAINTTVEVANYRSAMQQLKKLSDDFIKDNFESDTDGKIRELKQKIEDARAFLEDYKIPRVVVDYEISKESKEKLEQIISAAEKEIEKLSGSINEKAQKWKEDWAQVWNKFNAELANDPFYNIETEHFKKLEEAAANYVGVESAAISQINEYYTTKKGEIINKLADEEKRIAADLSKTRVDNLEYEYRKALDDINKLEAQRIIAAEDSAEEIARVRERFEGMRNELKINLDIEIDKTKLEEARAAVKDWQQELSDSAARALMSIEGFSGQASVLISDMAAQLASISFDGLLNGLDAIGKAFASGGDAAENLAQALSEMAKQILDQLPMMFMQAGLQLIASGQWALGLGFIAAAGSTAMIKGYVGEKINAEQNAAKNAHGNIYDASGVQAFVRGGTFSNQIVQNPTLFKFARGTGLMGEAGPEAIMPLKRMANGDLGVTAANGAPNVTVTIINNTGAEVQTEESVAPDGSQKFEIIVGRMVDKHIASGKADRVMSSRYGLRAPGV
jgi:lambda family phage tail tape measure protein